MGKFCDLVDGLKPAMLMVLVQVAYAGVNVFYKLAANDGMSPRIIIAYRFIFATAFMVPLALIVERKGRPKLSWTILFQAFFCGLLGGSMAQNLYAESLYLTSATFVSAMANLVPAFTFILAVSFRLEKLGLQTVTGQAKVTGTIMGIGGAMVLTFYKGKEIDIWSTHVNLLRNAQPHGGHVAPSHGNHALGSMEAICSCVSYALWLIIQAKMSANYPFPYSSTALMCMMGSIQAIVFALCVEKDWNQWRLGWNIRLLTVAYTGIVASGAMVTLIVWCVRMRGPVYVSIFSPLVLILVAISGSLILDEKLHLGSILGSALIVCGLYGVLWGKSKELKKQTRLAPSKSSREAERINVVVTTTDIACNDDTTTVDNLLENKHIEKEETIEDGSKEKVGTNGID